jgi:hypothetical protein
MEEDFVKSSDEDKSLRHLLDDLAPSLGFIPSGKEAYFEGFYLDRLWYTALYSEMIPVIGFEIERGVPINERLRKDITNLAWSRAPLGYIVVPDRRIRSNPKVNTGSTAENWYANTFRKTFDTHCKPVKYHCEIRLLDFDKLMETKSLSEARIDT